MEVVDDVKLGIARTVLRAQQVTALHMEEDTDAKLLVAQEVHWVQPVFVGSMVVV